MMSTSYRKILWGFLITIFDLNVGSFNVLPDFIGYFIMGLGINAVYEEFENNNLRSAGKLSNVMALYSLIVWIVNFGITSNVIGVGLDQHPVKWFIDSASTVITGAVVLVMTFKIISGTIDLYVQREMNNEASSLIKAQRNYTVLYITGLLLICLSFNISNEYLNVGSTIYMIVIYLYFAVIVSGIRKTSEIK